MQQNKIATGLFWKLFERLSVYIVQFLLQVVLARLLSPEHYGTLSIMIIFTTLANVFIQNGFNTALIQNKEVSEEDYSSVFWVSLVVAGILYVLLYLFTPAIAAFYSMPEIIGPFRVLILMLFPGAYNSIQLAKATRNMDFKVIFTSNIVGIVVSGVVGIVLACFNAGLWSLVAQTLLNVVMSCLVMAVTVKWRPSFTCNIKRIKVLFSFGWKLLVSSLVDTLYQDLRSLIIGKKYDSGTLGFYNRGKQFPQMIIGAINGAVQSVLLPAMSSEQDDSVKVKELMRNSIMLSSYIIFPMMAGLAAVATPLVSLVLTDKWLPCVPYMQIYCFSLAFYPVHTCNLQAINAMGRSDIFLKLELIKKGYGVILLIIAVFCFKSPIAIAMTGIFTTVISCFVNAYPNKKLVNYSYFEQMKDILPSFLLSMMMGAIVYVIQGISPNIFITLVIQVITGIAIYIFMSVICRIEPFIILIKIIKNRWKK